jgi:hypothetical protein
MASDAGLISYGPDVLLYVARVQHDPRCPVKDPAPQSQTVKPLNSSGADVL